MKNENEDDFYISLVSNASMNIFPDNTIASFTNRFDYIPMRLDENWVCGLTDIYYPVSWYNIPNEESISMLVGSQVNKLILSPNNFESPDKLVTAINDTIKQWSSIADIVNVPAYKVDRGRFVVDNDGVVKINGKETKMVIKFSPNLDSVLGITQKRPIYLNEGMTQLNVYCDIIDPCIVGDKYEKLLRRVNHDTEKAFGFPMHVSFDDPYYHKLSVFNFQQININIMSELGMPVRFNFGRVSLDLHFKKIK